MLSSKLYTSIYKYMNYSFIKKYIPVYTSIWFSSELYTSTYHHMTVHDCSRKVWNCIYVYTLCSNDSIPAAPARLARPKAVNSTLPLEWHTIHGHTSSSTMVFISSHPFLSPPAPPAPAPPWQGQGGNQTRFRSRHQHRQARRPKTQRPHYHRPRTMSLTGWIRRLKDIFRMTPVAPSISTMPS